MFSQVATLPEARMFSSVFRGSGACGVAKTIYKQFCFSTWACATGFNNNNNINNNNNNN